jgi:DNA gyrase subunit B
LKDFDINNLKFNKIVIAADADVDGFQISVLFINLLYKLMPKLIESGHVYVALAPLYLITLKDGNIDFA